MPSLKIIVKTKIKGIMKQIKEIMHSIICDDNTVTVSSVIKVTRVLLVGSYLMTKGLGEVRMQSQNKMKGKGKIYWQKRVKKKHC